jgi:hypothetical protein
LPRHLIAPKRRKTRRIKEQDLVITNNSNDNEMYLSSKYPMSVCIMDKSTLSPSLEIVHKQHASSILQNIIRGKQSYPGFAVAKKN